MSWREKVNPFRAQGTKGRAYSAAMSPASRAMYFAQKLSSMPGQYDGPSIFMPVLIPRGD